MVGFARRLGALAVVALSATAISCHSSRVITPPEPTVPDAALSSVAVSPATPVVANGVATFDVTVTVKNALGNALPDVAVELAASGTANVLTPATPVRSDGAGVARFQVASTKAEEKILAATAAGIVLTEAPAAAFIAGPASAAHSSLRAASASAVADGIAAVELTATVADAFGNPVEGAQVALRSLGESEDLTQPPPTGADGTAVGSVRSTVAGVKTIVASIGGVDFPASASASFVTGGVSATLSSLQVEAVSPVADTVEVANLTATIVDAQRNPIAGATVTFAATGTGNVLTASAVTDASGIALGTIASSRAEAKTLSATVGAVTLAQTPAVTFVAGPPAASRSALVVGAATVLADGVQVVPAAVTVRDAFDNAVAGAQVTLTAPGAVVSQPGPTGADGAALGGVTSTSAGAKVVTATVDGAAFPSAGTASFSAGPISAERSLFVVAPGTPVADLSATSALTVTVRDAFDNPIAGAVVSFSSAGLGAVLSGPVLSGADGVATGTISSSKTGAKSIVAHAGAVTLATTGSATFVAGPVDPVASLVSATPASVSTDGSTATVSVVLVDAFQNPVPGAAVVLSATGSGNTFVQPGATDASGAASGTLTSTVAEAKVVTATAGGVALAQRPGLSFVAGAPSPSQSVLAASPASQTTDAGALVALTATVKDAHGNPVPGVAVTFSATGTGNTIAVASATTDASGVATSALSSTKAEAKTVTATVGGQAVTQAVTFTAGAFAPAASVLNPVGGSGLVADGASAATLSATVRDANGNPKPGAAVTFLVDGVPAGTVQTDAAGLASVTYATTVAGTKLVTATVGGVALPGSASVTFAPGAPSSLTTTVAAAPTSLVAGDSTRVTLTVKDAQNNPVALQAVSVAISGTGNSPAGPVSGVTGVDGTFAFSLASSVAEAKTLTATAGAATATTTVTFTPGVPSSLATAVAAVPASLLVGDSTTVTVTVKDTLGNAVPGQAVRAAISGSGNTPPGPVDGATDAAGAFSFSFASTVAEVKTLTATAAGATATGTVTFLADQPNALTSTLAVSPETLPVGEQARVAVTVKDHLGNPVAGQPVSVDLSGAGNVPAGPVSGATGADGTFAFTFTSTGAGPKFLTATVAGFELTGLVTFTPGAPSAVASTFDVTPDAILASETAIAAIFVADRFGNPVEGVTPVLTGAGGFSLVSPPFATGPDGLSSAAFTMSQVGTWELTATFGAVVLRDAIEVGPGLPVALAIDWLPQSAYTAGVAMVPVPLVRIVDTWGNTVPGATADVQLSLELPSPDARPASLLGTTARAITDGGGVAFPGLSVEVANDGYRLVADTVPPDLYAQAKSTPFAVHPYYPGRIAFTAQPVGKRAGELLAPFQVSLLDRYGNAAGWEWIDPIVLTVNGPPAAGWSGTTSALPFLGVATFSDWQFFTAGDYTLTATTVDFADPALTVQTTSDPFTIVPAPASATLSSLVASVTSIVVDGVTPITLTATAVDAYLNPIVDAYVTVDATGADVNWLSDNPEETGLDGSVGFLFLTTKAEEKEFTATVEQCFVDPATSATVCETLPVGHVDVAFLPAAPSAANSTFGASPTELLVGGTSQLQVTLRDPWNNPTPDQPVAFAVTDPAATIQQPLLPTDATGAASGAVTFQTPAAPHTVTAISGAVQLTAEVDVYALPTVTVAGLDPEHPKQVFPGDTIRVRGTLGLLDGTGQLFVGGQLATTVITPTFVYSFPAPAQAGILTVEFRVSDSALQASAFDTIEVIAGDPAITSFTATPVEVASGSATLLTGVFQNGLGAIDNAVGSVQSGVAAATEPLIATLRTTVPFTLTVTGAPGTVPAVASTTVTVIPEESATSGLVPCSGGVRTVQDPADDEDLYFSVTVPAAPAAYCTTGMNFSVAFTTTLPNDPTTAPLPSGTVRVGPVVDLQKDTAGDFLTPMVLQLPYDAAALVDPATPAVFWWDAAASRYRAVAVSAIDPVGGLITASSVHTGTFVVLAIPDLATSLRDAFTGFDVSEDGFPQDVANVLSPATTPNPAVPGGYSAGMTAFASWYYTDEKAERVSGLGQIDDPAGFYPTVDADDVLQLMARLNVATQQAWTTTWRLPGYSLSDAQAGMILLTDLLVTGAPVPVTASDAYPASQALSVLVYGYDAAAGKFRVYDPNLNLANYAFAEDITVSWDLGLMAFRDYTPNVTNPDPAKVAYIFDFNFFAPTGIPSVIHTRQLDPDVDALLLSFEPPSFSPLQVVAIAFDPVDGDLEIQGRIISGWPTPDAAGYAVAYSLAGAPALVAEDFQIAPNGVNGWDFSFSIPAAEGPVSGSLLQLAGGTVPSDLATIFPAYGEIVVP